jgi:hypothetical protein
MSDPTRWFMERRDVAEEAGVSDGYPRRRLRAGDRCDVEGCYNVAVSLEWRRFGLDTDGNELTPGVFAVCVTHDDYFAKIEDGAEYGHHCDNCGCNSGVN